MPNRTYAFLLLFILVAILSPAQTLTTLVVFNGSNGSQPDYGSLVQGTDGSFYGTTSAGGANGEGTVFKITPGGALTTLYNFNVSDGQMPVAGLVQAADGNFYGTTGSGGTYSLGSFGTIFKMTPGGTLTTLYSFTDLKDGLDPQTTLIQGADGNFYGTTGIAIFKLTPGGTLTVLHDYTGFPDLMFYNGLIQATDGNLFGTAGGGGSSGHGGVFKITPDGTVTTLYSFTSGSDGSLPQASLIQASDGNLYGTTSGGGAYVLGTVFKITPGGTLTTLHSFQSTDGSRPMAPLIQATDGNFYGTTYTGGANNRGTIFEMTPDGTLTTLHSFNFTDGDYPKGGLVEGADGNLYGATSGTGNPNDLGTVFELQLMLPARTPSISVVQNAEGGASTIAPNTWVTILGSNLAPAGDSRTWQASDFVSNQMPTMLDGVSVTMNGGSAYVAYISPTQINVLTPPDLARGPVQVQVTTNTGTGPAFTVQAQQESPSFFIFGGGPYVAATHANGNIIGPATLYPGQSTPAQPGEIIVIYANGFGPTSVPVVKGSLVQSGTLSPLPAVTIGGIPATVQFAGLISPGLYQFNVVAPVSASAGDNAITATYNGFGTQSGALLTVQP
jgi:uncharacterized protein (TIGR03437 family)